MPIGSRVGACTGSIPVGASSQAYAWQAVRTDPTDNGGLFIGRRPGSAPIRYRAVPERRLGMRSAGDKLFAGMLLATMVLVSLAFWGPIPAAWMWIGAQVDHQTGSGSLAIAVACLGLLLTVLEGLVLLKRLDHFWILVRRAAGYDQRTGTIGTVFALAAIAGVTLFAMWMLLLAGPGPELFGGRG
jgi:hypothetical protein